MDKVLITSVLVISEVIIKDIGGYNGNAAYNMLAYIRPWIYPRVALKELYIIAYWLPKDGKPNPNNTWAYTCKVALMIQIYPVGGKSSAIKRNDSEVCQYQERLRLSAW